MSFTLMRYKDGVPAPIRMSIWDAFKGAPPPRPPKPKVVSTVEYAIPVVPVLSTMQPEEGTNPANLVNPTESAEDTTADPGIAQQEVPVECACCHKIHTTQQVNEGDKKDNEDKSKKKKKDGQDAKKDNKDNSKDGEKDDKQGPSRSTNEQESYSKANNKKIIEMKKADPEVAWDKILTEIGKKSKSQIKEHWKKINPDNQDKKDEEDEGKSEGSKDVKGKGKESDKKAEGKDNGDKKKGTTNKATAKEKTESSELKSWSDRYDRQKWIAAASRHYDLTGQRITAATAKRLAEGT